MTTCSPSELSTARPVGEETTLGGAAMAALLVAGLLFPLSQALVTVASPALHRDLGPVAANWAQTVVLVVAAVCAPAGGLLGDRLGRRPVLFGVLGLVLAGAVLALIPALVPVPGATAVFLTGRALEGCAVAVYPLAFGLLRRHSPPGRLAVRVAAMTGAVGAGNGLGVASGGPLAAAGGTAVLLLVPAAAALTALLLALATLPPGAGAPQAGGWPLRRRVAAVCTRTTGAVYTCAVLTGVGMFGAFMLVPLVALAPPGPAGPTGTGLGAPPALAGLYLLPHAVTMMAAVPLAGRLHRRYGSRRAVVVGNGLALAATALALAATSTGWLVALSNLLLGLGVGTAFAAMDTLVVEATPAAAVGLASGLTMVARSGGAAASSQVAVAVLAHAPTLDGGLWAALAVTGLGFAAAVAVAVAAIPRRPPRGT